MDFRRSERQRVEVRSWSTPNISKLHSLTLVATLPDSITRRSYERERVDGLPGSTIPLAGARSHYSHYSPGVQASEFAAEFVQVNHSYKFPRSRNCQFVGHYSAHNFEPA